MMTAVAAVVLGALLPGGPAEPAAARQDAGPAVVSLATDDCPAVPREPLARLLALELERPVLPPEQAADAAVRVQVACAGATVRLTVEEPAKGIQLRRVAAFPAEREDVLVRLVALAIAELVLTSRAELSFEKVPDARAEGEPLTARALSPASQAARAPGRAYVLAFGQALGPFSGLGVGWGGGLRLGWAFGRRWLERPSLGPVVDVELAAAESSADRTLGTVAVSLWSATVRALLRLRAGRAWLDLGAGGRFGLAQLQGQPADPTVAEGSGVAGTWAGPAAYFGVGAHFRHVVVELGVEGGRVLRTVSGTVDQGAPISIAGNWACTTVAAGWGE